MSEQRPVGPARHPSAGNRRNIVTVLSPRGPVPVIVPGRRARSLIASHLNAVRRYLELGDDRRLRQFEGRSLKFADGGRLELVTDRATIDRLAEGGAVHFELYRR